MLLKDRILIVSLPAVLLFVALAGWNPSRAMAAPIGLMERFALAEDREAVLAELIPGSEDYFFYHCLHYQNTLQLDRSEAILKDWVAKRKGSVTALMQSMTDRQRLLSYDQSPRQTIDYLVRRLGIQLHHSSPAKKGTRRYGSELGDFINLEQLVKDSLRNNVRLAPRGMQIAADWYLAGQDNQAGLSLNDYLKRVDGSYLVGLDRLVIQELQSRPARDQRFGDLAAHQFLTLEELDNVARNVPAVADDNPFVHAKLQSLRPSADVDLSQQPEQRRDYLVRVETYVRGLPESYNSMKASATYRLLEANLQAGIWDESLFLRYLQLPRQSPLISPILARNNFRANLNEDFTQVAILPPIRDEQPLIETYLEHFLRDAKDVQGFERYLQPDFLRRMLARTKLMAGVANPDPYYDMLSAAERQQLRDKTQVSFAPQNPKRFASDAATKLLVDIKNVDKLVVRVYEMNSLAYYRANDQRLDTDVDLDGLIATHEHTIEYDRPQIVRHRELIAIPEIKERGVWIVDLVGKGLRARTLIRRGDLQTVQSSDANGMQITVLDENRDLVPQAKIYVGSQEFTADENGRVFLPMVNKAVQRDAIVSDGKIAEPLKFRHLEESYALRAGFYLDRTLLQMGSTAEVLVRSRLMLGDTPIDPATLQDASVQIIATDLEGIATTKRFDDVKLEQSKDLSLRFRVPPRLAKIDFQLSGHVVGLSDRRQRELTADHSIKLAGIRRTTQTVDAFLTRDGDDYVIETRGRSGEAVPSAVVRLSFLTSIGEITPSHFLQSDEDGRVRLGPLSDVRKLTYGIAQYGQHEFDLQLDQQIWPSSIHLATDQPLQLPVVDGSQADNYRLLELRDGMNRSDRSSRLAIENGFLTAEPLPAGDFKLVNRLTGEETQVVVVDGPLIDRILVGKIRHREKNVAPPLSIKTARRNPDGSLSIELSGTTDLARVHLVASRYFDLRSPLDDLFLGFPSLSGRQLSLALSGYVSDLRLGDEYEYVLRRRYATKYPGVMLPQPSVLLNPWETETTSNDSQSVRAGDAPMPSAAPAKEATQPTQGSRKRSDENVAASSDYDFLADSGVIAANLIPDKDGCLQIPADAIAGMPILQIIVADPVNVLRKTIAAELSQANLEDLRLAKSLPTEKPYSFERIVSVVSKDSPLDLATLGSAQVQVYADVGSLLKLYRTLSDDPRLEEFQMLGQWNTLSSERKLDAYSKLACHELHLFLQIHDRGFFDAVVKPYLSHKKEKQFIDHWLLDEDLAEYTTLWKYRQLSAAERALLAIRMPELKSQIRRDLDEMVALLPDDDGQLRVQIESALRARGMDDLPGEIQDRKQLAEVELRTNIGSDFGMNTLSDKIMMERDEVPAAPMIGGMGGGGRQSTRMKRELSFSNAKKSRAPVAQARMLGRRSGTELGKQLGFYQELDSTKQWAESNWDRVRVVGGPAPIDLIGVNPFWKDLANDEFETSGRSAPSVSPHLLRCADNRHSALVALAMCGLPLEPGDVGLPSKPETVYSPAHPVALVTKRLRSLNPAEGDSNVLIGQLFRPIPSKNQFTDETDAIIEPDLFATGQPYQGRVVVSNPTPESQIVELFWQIPAGSIPLGGSQTTDSKTVKLAPFAVSSVEYSFYFPKAGQYVHYPAAVSRDETLLARGKNKSFEVVEDWTDDNVSWKSIATDGMPAEIKTFLATANLNEIDWSLIFHRLQNRDVYDVIVTVLGDARLPVADAWAYGFQHGDPDAMRHYLNLRQDLVSRTGPFLKSPLLSIDSIDRGQLEHLEYAPLIRARIHRLGDTDEILNPTFLGQYQKFTRRIGFQPSMVAADKLPLAYYLLLQNRIEESIKVFNSLERESVPSHLQYDYLAGYLSLHQGEYEGASRIAQSHADHPIPRWKNRFAEMAAQIRQRFELMDSGQLALDDEGKKFDNIGVSPDAADLSIADRERANSKASATVPEVIARVEDDTIRIDHRNADQIEINFYGVDLELLFSKAPFARKDLQRIAMVRPTRSTILTMKSKTGAVRVPIPNDLKSQTLLVEANVGASRSTTLYYGGELTTYVSEGFGQLQTTDASTHRPLAGAYVKVYARYGDGKVRFYKDGYTDGRGRFDYISVSAGDAQGAERFAILVLSQEKGATLHDVEAP